MAAGPRASVVNLPTGLYSWYVNIDSGDGLEPLGNKPLPEPMSTEIFVAT